MSVNYHKGNMPTWLFKSVRNVPKKTFLKSISDEILSKFSVRGNQVSKGNIKGFENNLV